MAREPSVAPGSRSRHARPLEPAVSPPGVDAGHLGVVNRNEKLDRLVQISQEAPPSAGLECERMSRFWTT